MAEGFFEEALNQDARCAEAYLGKWLASKRQVNLESLAETFIDKYDVSKKEKRQACKVDSERIAAAVEKYIIPEYLGRSDIEKEYYTDLTYESEVASRKEQKQKFLTELNAEKLFVRALQYASGNTAEMLSTFQNTILKYLEEKIQVAKDQDQRDKDNKIRFYTQFLEQADCNVQKQFEAAENRREEEYQRQLSAISEAKSVNEYETCIKLLKKLTPYKDVDELVQTCQKEIIRLTEEKRKEEARQAEIRRQAEEKAAKKKKTITAVIFTIAVVCVAVVIVYVKVIVPNNNYTAATNLIEEKDYVGAYELLDDLGGYKDSTELKQSIFTEYRMQLMCMAEIGSQVAFGAYEQDNDTSNGKEEIEWIVLDKQEGGMLLISRYALDNSHWGSKYALDNSNWSSVTWETCSLRGWLNGAFLDAAFSEDEKEMIQTTDVKADKNPSYSTDPGKDTKDQVFLLSIEEANRYFSTDSERSCLPTSYAKAQNPFSYIGSSGNCWWWLRSPGYCDVAFRAACVDDGGSVDYRGSNVHNGGSVRPALWINLES